MAQTILVAAGQNLFQIAASELQDATQWIRIAQANGLSDPFIYAQTSLTIPDPDPTQTGGIPAAQ